jgi:hypothetical protein
MLSVVPIRLILRHDLSRSVEWRAVLDENGHWQIN